MNQKCIPLNLGMNLILALGKNKRDSYRIFHVNWEFMTRNHKLLLRKTSHQMKDMCMSNLHIVHLVWWFENHNHSCHMCIRHLLRLDRYTYHKSYKNYLNQHIKFRHRILREHILSQKIGLVECKEGNHCKFHQLRWFKNKHHTRQRYNY